MFQKGAITAIFKADNKDFNRGLKDVNNSLEKLGSRGKAVADRIADLDRRKQTAIFRMRQLESQNKQGTASYRRLGDQVKNLNDRMETSRMRLKEMGEQGKRTAWFMSPDYFKIHLLANALGDLASNAIQLATEKLSEMGRAFFEVGIQAEQTEIAFEVMLGSAEAGQKMLDDLSKFASKTPFEIPQLEQTAKSLLGMGFASEEILPTLDVLGNISAGVGTDKLPFLTLALSQVRTAGKLTGSELRQFSENGVPLLEGLAKNAGVSMREMREAISDGAVSYEDVLKVLEQSTQEGGRFFNLMGRQSGTLAGRLSNMADNVTIRMRALFEKLRPTFHRILDFVEAIPPTISKISGYFKPLASDINDSIKSIDFERIKKVSKDVFQDRVLPVLKQVGEFIKNIDFQGIEQAVKNVFQDVLLPVLKRVIEFVKNIDFVKIYNDLINLKNIAIEFFENTIIPFLQPVIDGLMSFKSVWDSIVFIFRDALLPVLIPIGTFLLFLAAQVLPALMYAWQQVSPPLMEFIGSVLELISTLMTVLIPVIVAVIGISGVLTAFIITVLTPVFQILWASIVQAFTGILKAITGVIDIVIGIFQVFIGIAKGIFTGDFSMVVEGFKKIFSGIWKFIEGSLQLVLSPITGIVDGIKNTFKGLDLFQIGKDIIDGLIRGIKGKAGEVRSIISNMTSDIKNSITSAFDINSPSKWMRWTMDMVWDGAIIQTKKRENDVVRSSEDMMNAIQKPIAQSVSNMSSINNTNNQSISTTNNNNFSQSVSFNSMTSPSDAEQKQLADKMQTFFKEGIKTIKTA